MTFRLRSALSCLVLAFPLAAASAHAQSDPSKDNPGYTWPSHYDFYMPFGTKGGGPVYAKPAYKGVNLTLSCREAVGLLKLKGYGDVEELSCSGAVYRFAVNHDGGRIEIEIDPKTGDIVRRHQL